MGRSMAAVEWVCRKLLCEAGLEPPLIAPPNVACAGSIAADVDPRKPLRTIGHEPLVARAGSSTLLSSGTGSGHQRLGSEGTFGSSRKCAACGMANRSRGLRLAPESVEVHAFLFFNR